MNPTFCRKLHLAVLGLAALSACSTPTYRIPPVVNSGSSEAVTVEIHDYQTMNRHDESKLYLRSFDCPGGGECPAGILFERHLSTRPHEHPFVSTHRLAVQDGVMWHFYGAQTKLSITCRWSFMFRPERSMAYEVSLRQESRGILKTPLCVPEVRATSPSGSRSVVPLLAGPK